MSIDFERQETAAFRSSPGGEDEVVSTISKGAAGSGGYSPTLQTTGATRTGAAVSDDARQPTHRKQPKVEPRIRQKCRILFGSCIDSINRAIDDSDDFFACNNALEQLKDTLAELWAWRDKREEPFAEAINVLQGVLLEKSVENLEAFEINALKSVFLRLYDEPVVTRFVVNEVVFLMMEHGIDVFRPIK